MTETTWSKNSTSIFARQSTLFQRESLTETYAEKPIGFGNKSSWLQTKDGETLYDGPMTNNLVRTGELIAPSTDANKNKPTLSKSVTLKHFWLRAIAQFTSKVQRFCLNWVQRYGLRQNRRTDMKALSTSNAQFVSTLTLFTEFSRSNGHRIWMSWSG